MKPTLEMRAVPALRGLGPAAMTSLLTKAGFPAFRAKQLFEWIHRKGVRQLDEARTLPKELRAWLNEHTILGGIAGVAAKTESEDGSTKFLFSLSDGRKIESVLMPGAVEGRFSLCVSSQVGCAVDCKFCVTGKNGFFRNLEVDEIVDQFLFARQHLAQTRPECQLRNMVFMGMGEPLLNTGNVLESIRILTNGGGADLSARKVTVSTSGILPGLEELGGAHLGVGLAISLNAPTQQLREEIMPITRRYPLSELMQACRDFPLESRQRITFEYVLMKGVNDTVHHARQVVRLVHGIPCKINLIPFNPDKVLPYERPDLGIIEAFRDALLNANLTCSVRWSKALDVRGACGQLAGQYRQKVAGKYVVKEKIEEEEE